jgi:hypothetical protein
VQAKQLSIGLHTLNLLKGDVMEQNALLVLVLQYAVPKTLGNIEGLSKPCVQERTIPLDCRAASVILHHEDDLMEWSAHARDQQDMCHAMEDRHGTCWGTDEPPWYVSNGRQWDRICRFLEPLIRDEAWGGGMYPATPWRKATLDLVFRS